MSKKLSFYQKIVIPIICPLTKADFTRREKMSKNANLTNITIFSGIIWITIWKLLSSIALIFFEYDLWWFFELLFSLFFTYLVVNPLVWKMMIFKKSLNTNLLWIILQASGIIYLYNILWSWFQKIEHKTK